MHALGNRGLKLPAGLFLEGFHFFAEIISHVPDTRNVPLGRDTVHFDGREARVGFDSLSDSSIEVLNDFCRDWWEVLDGVGDLLPEKVLPRAAHVLQERLDEI